MTAEPAGRTPWSLRRRLVLGIVALLALLAVVIGGVTVAALRGQLVARLDRVLLAASERTTAAVDDVVVGGPGFPAGSIVDILPGQGAGAVGLVTVDGQVVRAGYVGEDGRPQLLTPVQLQALADVPDDRAPRTVSLGGSLGSYRAVATPLGDSGITVVNGLSLAEADATTSQLVTTVAAVGLAAIALAALLGSLVVRVALRPLTRVVETATRVSELPLESGEVLMPERVPDTTSSTEVGRVGAALNRLLGKVEGALAARHASEQKVRRFVADASHELRTPLATIRGYAELGRRESEQLPPDTARSLERIEAESVRMTTLVEDMLLLARLDAGRELPREPVGIARVVVEAVADAHVAGPAHHWLLDVPEEDVQVMGEPASLHQAVANLLANARIHTPPGTTVRVEVLPRPDSVVVTVTDDGPGIDAALVPVLFERFTRGDDARTRAGGSTGLGLAITAAIVEAHGGEVRVDSAPGRTAFAVELPRSSPLG
jgi:two-component system OmpR family sensor kinase